jgi:hypothetical protein
VLEQVVPKVNGAAAIATCWQRVSHCRQIGTAQVGLNNHKPTVAVLMMR